MDDKLFAMIPRRKSFHKFKGEMHLSADELAAVETRIGDLIPLEPSIQTAIRIVPREETNCKTGEYCVLFYSESKEYALYNAGYMLEQLDLWLVSQNIGSCWYGMSRPKKKTYQGLPFVIMLVVEKVDPAWFRQDITDTSRKSTDEIWQGDSWNEIADIVRFTPSACNSQPWLVRASNGSLEIIRVLGSRGIMPVSKVSYYNRIDMGIFLLFLTLCLREKNLAFDIKLLSDASDGQENLVARIDILA
jgi:Putative TM nitroreductase